jgi:hypothetical protein
MPLSVGDWVYVPASRFGIENGTHAVVKAQVSAVQDRSFAVHLAGGGQSGLISTGYAHRDVGVLVVTVGDFATEAATLTPLTKSVVQYLRLLLPDDMVRSVFVRGFDEFKAAWTLLAGASTHVVIVGHGDGDGLLFGTTGAVTAAGEIAAAVTDRPREYLMLACRTGRAEFAKAFSLAAGCRTLVAPFNSVHAATAAQFATTYFGERFLGGRTEKAAFNKLSEISSLGEARYRYWKAGQFEGR